MTSAGRVSKENKERLNQHFVPATLREDGVHWMKGLAFPGASPSMCNGMRCKHLMLCIICMCICMCMCICTAGFGRMDGHEDHVPDIHSSAAIAPPQGHEKLFKKFEGLFERQADK